MFKDDDDPAPAPTVAPVAPTLAPVAPTLAPVAPTLAPTLAPVVPTTAPTAYPEEFPVIVSNGDSEFDSEGNAGNSTADVLLLDKTGFVLLGFNTSELAALIPTLVDRDFSASLRLAHLTGGEADFKVSSLLAELPGPIETLENFTFSPDDLSAPLTATFDSSSTVEVDVTDLLFSAGTRLRRRTKEVPEEITFVLENADVAEILEFTSRESTDGKGPQLIVSLKTITESPSLRPSVSSAPSVSAKPSLRPSASSAPSSSAMPSMQPSVSSAPSVSAAPSAEERTPGCYLCGEGGVVTNPETIVQVPNPDGEGTVAVSCSQVAGGLFAEATTDQECSAAQETYGIVCGCVLETGCHLCGEGGVVGSPNALVDVPNPDGEGTVQVTCSVAAAGFLATDKTEPECLAVQETYGAACGCLEPATPGCELCGEGGELGKPDALVDVPNPSGEGTVQVTCQLAADGLFARETLEPECTAAQEAYGAACGCKTTGCQLCGENGRLDNPDASVQVPNPTGDGTVNVTCSVAAAGLLARSTTQNECSTAQDIYETDCGCVDVAAGCDICGADGTLDKPDAMVELPNPAGEGTLQVTCLEARAAIFATQTTLDECTAAQDTYGSDCCAAGISRA